jgi:hypothetical protein
MGETNIAKREEKGGGQFLTNGEDNLDLILV